MLPLESAIAPRLKSLGFRKKARTWWLSNAETIGVLNLQKSPYGERLYINLGVFAKQLGQEERPPEYRCHVRARLESVAPGHCWNDICSAEAGIQPSEVLVDAVLVSGVEWLHRLSTLEGIRSHLAAHGADKVQAVIAIRRLLDGHEA